MTPEFLAILEKKDQLGVWFIMLPICFGVISLILSVAKARKGIALTYITILTMASVLIPTSMIFVWWFELSDVATSHEDKEWIFNHDGGLLIAPLSASLIAIIFWTLSVLILSVRVLIARIKKKADSR